MESWADTNLPLVLAVLLFPALLFVLWLIFRSKPSYSTVIAEDPPVISVPHDAAVGLQPQLPPFSETGPEIKDNSGDQRELRDEEDKDFQIMYNKWKNETDNWPTGI